MATLISTDVETDFEAEARLDESIQFPHPLSRNPLNPANVLLTGGTGFLGTHILAELFRKTNARVHCLVRAKNDAEAKLRIVDCLRKSLLWQESWGPRICPIAGDLARPFFGWSPTLFRELAGIIDVVYHNAGWLNMAFPYERLKPTNVNGTREVLRFAGTVSTKPTHFVSTIAVFFNDERENGEVLRESDIPQYDASLRGGYGKSKWVADRLVARAQERGLPTGIYRPVRIMGHSQIGESSDENDILPMLLKGCILLGLYPSFDIRITLVPVDYVSSAMVHLASQEKSWGRSFHFFNPAPIEWTRLIAIFQSAGYPLQEVSYKQWWRELKKRGHRVSDDSTGDRNLFSKLLLALTAPHFLFYNRPPFEAGYTNEGLRGTEISCPPIDDALIGSYIARWQESGYLSRAGRAAQA